MKKITSIIALMAAFVMNVSAADQGTVSKEYSYKGFNSIEVSSFFEVTVQKSNTYAVDVIVSKEYEEYLDVKLKGTVLSIGFRSLPAKLQAASISKVADARVSLPELGGLELSGTAKFNTEDNFDLGNGVFNLSISGASSVNGLSVSASEARIYASGASKAKLGGDFVELHFNISGTSRIDAEANADDIAIKASGTAVLDMTGEYDEVNVESSGVANVTIGGKADSLEARTSGTASIDASKLSVKEALASLSGASVIKVNSSKRLEVSAQGASRCSYKDVAGLKIVDKGIARASSLKAEP